MLKDALLSMVEEPIESVYPSYKNCLHDDALSFTPHGSLAGINFIYDEDKDHRILEACYSLQGKGSILALYERKARLAVFTSSPVLDELNDLILEVSVAGDAWEVTQYLPVTNGWVELTDKLFRDMLVKQSQFMRKYYRLPS